ncbi:MAG TPA: hypothetical protein VGM56_32350 [Byssovorax sp.]
MAIAAEEIRARGADLERLTCGACGAPVPLADAAVVRCPHCAAPVEIPEAHRRAFTLERKDSASRAEAHMLYAELGVPPGRLLRACAVAFNGWWLVLGGGFVMMCASLFVVDFTFFMLGDAFHENVVETMPQRDQRALQFPPAIALAAVGAALGVYGRRRARSRQRLQAALAARPPEITGGPATCRACGAPLTVPDGALGVRCVYCGSDNLVALPSSWIAKASADVAAVDAEIEGARAELLAEQRRLRRGLVLHVGGITAGFGLFFLACMAGTPARATAAGVVPPSYADFTGEPRALARRGFDDSVHALATNALLSPRYERIDFAAACPVGAAPLELGPRDCDAKGCVVRLYAALHEGDRAVVTFTGLASRAKLAVSRHRMLKWPTRADQPFGAHVAGLDVVPGAPTSFVARWTAWHELLLETKGPPPTDARVCFAVSR